MAAFKVFLWVSITGILFLLGLLVELGPKWSPGLIHIPLSPGHGFTDQDAFALIPISLGTIWFSMGLWMNRTILRDYVRRQPEKSFVIALTIGLILGLPIGTGVGIIFRGNIIFLSRLF